MTPGTGQDRGELLRNLSVVLVRPAFAGNVGSVARVMSNFGVRDGRVVAPRCDMTSVEARQFATGPSAVILATMSSEKSLREAVANHTAVIGLTRRTGRSRKPTMTLDQVGRLLGEGPTALVFGPEESGLSDEDTDSCTHLLSLDVAEMNPSLNLSHAVAVTLSGVYGSLSHQTSGGLRDSVVAVGEIENFSDRLRKVVERMDGLGVISHPDYFSDLLIRNLRRSRPDVDELAAWHGFLTAVEKLRPN